MGISVKDVKECKGQGWMPDGWSDTVIDSLTEIYDLEGILVKNFVNKVKK